jgi:lipid-A-disaccharide synthase
VKIFFSVGEPSGDLHAANLIRRLRSQVPDIECVGFGGPKMESAGCHLLYELTQFAVMFLGQALKNLRFFFRLIAQADQYFGEHHVDAVVLIDYSGFNWWIARKAKKHKLPVFYYGVPQVWAWGSWRIHKIRKLVDHILCKLPFEVPWFAARGCRATYVGHPYFDQLTNQEYDEVFLSELSADLRPLLVLLPGSRKQEVTNNLPILLDSAREVAKSVPRIRIAIASYNEQQQQMALAILNQRSYSQLKSSTTGIELYVNRTPELMTSATVCLACSGSVSLELMYHRKPTVIVYRIKWWAMIVQAFLIRVRYITLVNLIAATDIRRQSWFSRNQSKCETRIGRRSLLVSDSRPNGVQNQVLPCPVGSLSEAKGTGREQVSPEQSPVMPEYLTSGNPAIQVAAHVIEWLTDESSRQQVMSRLDQLALAYAKPGATTLAADYILNQLDVSSAAANSKTSQRRSA